MTPFQELKKWTHRIVKLVQNSLVGGRDIVFQSEKFSDGGVAPRHELDQRLAAGVVLREEVHHEAQKFPALTSEGVFPQICQIIIMIKNLRKCQTRNKNKGVFRKVGIFMKKARALNKKIKSFS